MDNNLTVDNLLTNLTIYKDLTTIINNINCNEKVLNASAYLRVSTDMQTEFSPEAQLEDIIKYCIEKKIWLPKDNIFIEAGISGTRADKRPEFQKMINKAKDKSKPIDIILVHKLDRFARNREDSIVYKSMLRKKYNVDIVAVKELLPEDRKLAMMMESQLETWGEYYSMNLSDEVKKGLRKKANRGEHIGRPAFGYIKVVVDVKRINNQEKVIREMRIKDDEAEIVKTIFNKFINGESMVKICQYLNDLNIKTKNNNIFNDRTIRWILNNPVYIGKARWTEGGMQRNFDNPNTIIKESNFPPIIDIDVWNKAQDRLKEFKIVYNNKKKISPKQEHWLRGIMRCDTCGGVMVKAVKSFQCSNYTHGRCKISHCITVKEVEDAILTLLEDTFKNKPINIEINPKSFKNDSEIVILNNQLTQLDQKEERVKLAYENGIDTLEEYKENKTRLLNEKKILQSKIEEVSKDKDVNIVKNKIYKKCESAYKTFKDKEISDFDKSVIAHELFDKIVFVKSEHKLIIYYK